MNNEGSRTILIIDGDHDDRVTLRRILEDAGHFVVSATNGADGLSMLGKITPPSLIIIATNMPIMTGPEFIAHVSKDVGLRSIPIAHIAEPSEQPLAGTCHAIQKPIVGEKVLEIIAKC